MQLHGKKEKEKERRQCKHHQHGLGKDVRFVSYTTQWMQRHTTSHLENKNKRSLSVGSRWLGGRSLHTTRSIALRYLWGLCSVPVSSVWFLLCIWWHISIVYIMRLRHLDQEIRGCGVGSLCGCCRWCLLLLAGWSFTASEWARHSTYVVLVPFLFVE